MFSTKSEVDKHVESCSKRIISEAERNNRNFAFAKLYHNVGEYEQARRYVSSYLSVKPKSAEAHHLLGMALEKLGKKEAALESFRTSLQLDPKQNNLVLKMCELLASNDMQMDQSGARYFCEMAQTIDPNNPAVTNLKERLIMSENDDPEEVSKLLLLELEVRPTDVHLRIRLLKHLLQYNKIDEAYKHVSDIENKHLLIFSNNLLWYEITAEVLIRYQRDASPINLKWQFWFLLISVLEKLTALSLDEKSDVLKESSSYVSTLFNYDQTLKTACENINDCPDRQLQQAFIDHFRGQLYLHLSTALLKNAKKDLIKFKDALLLSLPLLVAAYHLQPVDLQSIWINHIPEDKKKMIQSWHREASFRCSQAGHILLSAARDRKIAVLDKAAQYSTGLWREQLFKRIFVLRDQQLKINGSYFASSSQLIDVVQRLPDKKELLRFDEVAQLVFPDSLHHYIWISLCCDLAELKYVPFEGLQYSIKNLGNCAAESLSFLDVAAFVYCSTFCARANLNNVKHLIYYNADKPSVLPAAITDHLGSVNQAKFLIAAYKMLNNQCVSDMGELRLTLVRGIEIVRCVGRHGLDVNLLINLATIFAERSKLLSKQSEIDYTDSRAELYWKTALPLLEKLKNNQLITYSSNRLFDCKAKDMSVSEISHQIDKGKLFLGGLLMKRKEYETALKTFEELKDPEASFYQAQIYKQLADGQMNLNNEHVTSEMRSQNIILLSRARDCLYLTLDRLREPSVDRSHPLNAQLGTEIEKIERLLSRIDPDCANRNECDGMSDENVSSAESNDHYPINFISRITTPYTPRNKLNVSRSTPLSLNKSKREARPSPERLDAQLRQLTATKDAAIGHVLEQIKAILETHKTVIEELQSCKEAIYTLSSSCEEFKVVKQGMGELKEIKQSVDELKASVEGLHNFRNVLDMVYEIKREIQDLKKDSSKPSANDGLYVLDDEYSSDYNLGANLNFNPNLYPSYPRVPPPAAAPSLYHPSMYPLYNPMGPYGYPNLGLPQAGLPFASEQQMTDFRQLAATLPAAYTQQQMMHPNLNQSAGLPNSNLNVGMLTGQGLAQVTSAPTIFNNYKSSISITSTPSTATTASSSTISGSSNQAPANIVITSSDPLPSTTAPVSQPVLSVTIPPQHLKGNVAKSQPHNYQIQLPTTSISSMASTPSVLSQPSPAISTQSILSNVAPPLYSSIPENKKTPSKNVSLGLQIEKTLEETFNSPKPEDLSKPLLDTPVNSSTKASIKPDVKIGTSQSATSLGGFLFTSTPTFKPTEAVTPVRAEAEPEKLKASPFAGFTFGATSSTTLFNTSKVDLNISNKNPNASISLPEFNMSKTSVDENAGIEDFVPTAEFKPVVPLPDIVEVKTGEENSEVLFDGRAKLLRFDSDNKEWKERGLGNIKVLKEQNSIRLLMRREQIHKVCCNHQLLKNTVFKFMPKNEKAITWCAQDFAEEVLRTETFAIRFKTEDQAASFLTCINDAQKSLDDKNCIYKRNTDKHMRTEPPPKPVGFGEKFKAAKGSWECKNCFIVNEGKANYCSACETPKSSSSPQKSADVSAGAKFSFGITGQKTEQKPVDDLWKKATQQETGSWSCPTCYIRNAADKTQCVACNTSKDGGVQKQPKGISLETPGLKFNFGVPKTEVSSSVPEKTAAKAKSFGDAFKPKEGSWECKSCYTRNEASLLYCASCEAPKDDTVPKKPLASGGVNLDTAVKFNFGILQTKEEKPVAEAKTTFRFGETAPVSTFSFGNLPSQPSGAFTFKPATASMPTLTSISTSSSVPTSTPTPISTPTTISTPTPILTPTTISTENSFVFGSPKMHEFEFTPKSPRRISTGQGDEESDNSYLEEEADNIYFKPVIPLPDKVDVKTGEEHEEVLYCHRAKLFRFVAGEWKERGLGDIKILKNEDNGRLRVVMRREQILKICLNHALSSKIEYIRKGENAWLFHAADFSEGEITHDQFCVKFKTGDIANEFKEAVDKALFDSTEDADKSTEVDDEVEFVSETIMPLEEQAEAKKLGLPANFLNYRNLPYCNCDQCKKDDEYFWGTEFSKEYLSAPKSTLSVSSSAPKSTLSVSFPAPKSTLSVSSPAPKSTLSVSSPAPNFGTPLSSVSNDLSFRTPSADSFKSNLTSEATEAGTLKSLLLKPVDKAENMFSTPTSVTTAGNWFGVKQSDAMKKFSFSLTSDQNKSTSSTSNNIFGGGQSTPNTAKNIFGATPTVSTPSTPLSSNTSIFGNAQSKPSTPGNIFGNMSSTPGNIFGNNTPAFGMKTNLFGGDSTLFGPKTEKDGKINIFGLAKDKITPTSQIFGSTTVSTPSELKTTNLKEDDEVILKCGSGISFSELAKQTTTDALPAFANTEKEGSTTPFAFLGAGKPIFGGTKKTPTKNEDADKTTGSDNEDHEGTTVGDDEYDPHYEPIVPMPDAITVSTGEEEETPIFNERAKLYRYDTNTSEWKERGVGQMKILYHSVRGTHRFLMRREQVHKLVLNELIKPDTKLEPLTTSDKAWTWGSNNYTDVGPVVETLAIKFKNCELAQQFFEAVQKSVQAVRQVQANNSLVFEDVASNEENLGLEDVTPNEEEYYDEEYDDERTLMYSKNCQLQEQSENGPWVEVSYGEVQVFYDPEIYGAKISFVDETGLVISNSVIGINTVMTLDNNICTWKSVEWASDELYWRTLRAVFPEEVDAQQLHYNYLEGLNYAQECDIVDEIPTHNEDEEVEEDH